MINLIQYFIPISFFYIVYLFCIKLSMEGNVLLQYLITVLCRVGMVLVHISVIPSSSVNLITFQHILNMSVSSVCFFCFGYRLSWINDLLDFCHGWILNDFLMQNLFSSWRLMILCEGLISMSIAGKAHLFSDMTLIIVISTIVYPLLKNISTSGTDLNVLLGSIVDFDYYNKEVILLHILPGSTAFVSCIMFGRNMLNLKDIDLSSVSINAQSFTLLGYSLIIMGYLPEVQITNVLFAIATAPLTMIILFALGGAEMDYWDCVKIMQSGMAGIISTMSCTNPYEAICITIFVIFVCVIAEEVLEIMGIEDTCNIITIHGVVGSFYLIIAPFLLKKDFQDIIRGCLLALLVFSTGVITGLICLLPFKFLGCLRNDKNLRKDFHELSETQERLTRKRKFQPGSHALMKIKKQQGASSLKLDSKSTLEA